MFDRDAAKFNEATYVRTDIDTDEWARIEALERQRHGQIIQDGLYRAALWVIMHSNTTILNPIQTIPNFASTLFVPKMWWNTHYPELSTGAWCYIAP
jgi:hypothetical protein